MGLPASRQSLVVESGHVTRMSTVSSFDGVPCLTTRLVGRRLQAPVDSALFMSQSHLMFEKKQLSLPC